MESMLYIAVKENGPEWIVLKDLKVEVYIC